MGDGMGDFADSPKWTLINDFTIHEDQTLNSGRPFMRTCVPKRLDVDVTSFEVIRYIEWPSNFGGDERAKAYVDKTYIKFSGDLDDKIVVFTMEGEVATFRTLTDATIRSLPADQIGGKHKATVFDGIGYSGMSSRDVPAEGLMDGEPGAISYLGEFEEHRGSGNMTPATLTASLFLDEDRFTRLLMALTLSSRPAAVFKLNILAELFESEVSASLSEPWMPHDYGLLMKGSNIGNTSARLESLAISTGPTGLKSVDPVADPGVVIDRMLGVDDRNERDRGHGSPVPLPDSSRAALKYQRYIFVALLVLILVTLFAR
ncbi:MAG: hypothetical protein E5W19_15260 [Mesorhizobium sp.]|nr:MAG: hypothetical protein E5W19_15260 [Mesorhizobium sp.]